MGKLSNIFGFLICRSSNSRKKTRNSANTSANNSTISRPETRPALQTIGNPSSNTVQRRISAEPVSRNVPQTYQSPKSYTLLRINTAFNKENVEVADFKPEQRTAKRRVKYNCPICFRYFSEMLKSDCCGNYICLYCAQDVNDYIKQQKIEKAACHFCKTVNFTVSDVKPEEKMKRYTDSPYSSASNTFTGSFANNNKLKFTDAIHDINKQYSATFSGFKEAQAEEAAQDKADERLDVMRSASCGFQEIRKMMMMISPKLSFCSDRVNGNGQEEDSEESENISKPLSSPSDGPYAFHRPHSHTYDLSRRNFIDENDNMLPRRMVSVIFEKENEDITLSEIPSGRILPNDRNRSPIRMSVVTNGAGRVEDRSTTLSLQMSENRLSGRDGLRG